MNLINCTEYHNITNIETNYLIKFHDYWLKINILDWSVQQQAFKRFQKYHILVILN